MPLGVLWGATPLFKVYKGTGLFELLERDEVENLLLYSPKDPADYFLSIRHDPKLESEGPCKPPKDFTLYVICEPSIKEIREDFKIYECRNVEIFEGNPEPYSRAYGCFVEMLVVITKMKAGVLDQKYLSYLDFLRWCIERSAPKSEKMRVVLNYVLQSFRDFEHDTQQDRQSL